MATIDELLDRVDSKYTLVHFAAKRAREINNYYHSLGEGLGQYVRPLVEHVDSNKPLSIAMEEIAQDKIVIQRPGDARAQVEALLGGDVDDQDDDDTADVLSLSGDAAIVDDELDDQFDDDEADRDTVAEVVALDPADPHAAGGDTGEAEDTDED